MGSIFILTDRVMSLKMNNCELTHEGLGYILMSLLTQPRLKLLECDCNVKRSQWNSGKYHVNQMLRKLLEKCLNLESLSIKNDPERGYQVDLDSFLNILKVNTSLITLDISGNSMTADNLAALKDVVLRNGVLRELHWDENNISSKNILGITHALKQNKALQIVAFPDKDFEKELLREKSTAKKMELQMIKKNFYRAVFENASTQGFQQSTTNYKRTAAKRGSFMATRPKNEVYQPQVGGNALGLPQFGAAPPGGMNGGGMNGGGIQAPPSSKRQQSRPPPNIPSQHSNQHSNSHNQQQKRPPPVPNPGGKEKKKHTKETERSATTESNATTTATAVWQWSTTQSAQYDADARKYAEYEHAARHDESEWHASYGTTARRQYDQYGHANGYGNAKWNAAYGNDGNATRHGNDGNERYASARYEWNDDGWTTNGYDASNEWNATDGNGRSTSKF